MADSEHTMASEGPYNVEDIRPEPLEEGSLSPIPHDPEEATGDDEEVASNEEEVASNEEEGASNEEEVPSNEEEVASEGKTESNDEGEAYSGHDDDQYPGGQEHEGSDDADSSIPWGTEPQQEAAGGDWFQDTAEDDLSSKPVGNWDSEASANFDSEGRVSYQGGICRPGSESDAAISWSDPLTDSVEAIEFLNAKILTSDYPFLTRFLCRKRKIDLPFQRRHQLITFVLNTIQEACYDFMRTHFPEQLELARIPCFDAIDIFDMIAFIEGMQFQHPNILAQGTWPDPSIANIPGTQSVGDVRHAALHRLRYSTRLLLHAVCLLHQLHDRPRLESLQHVLQHLYLSQDPASFSSSPLSSFPLSFSATAESLLDTASYPITTPQRFLTHIQSVLEHALFSLVHAGNPTALATRNFTCAEQIELQRWTSADLLPLVASCMPENHRTEFRRWLERAAPLRNLAAHPSDWGAEHDGKIRDAIRVLSYTDSGAEAVARIQRLGDEMREVREGWRRGYPRDGKGLQKLQEKTTAAAGTYFSKIYRNRWLRTHETQVYQRFIKVAEEINLDLEALREGEREGS